MSSVRSMLKVPNPAASPATSWTSAGSIAAATTLVLGAGFPLASHLMAQLMGPTERTIDWLRWIADYPQLANLTKAFELLALPFLFGTVFVYVLLSRGRSPRLAYAGGILLGCGMVGLSAVEGYETLAYALAQDGRVELAALAEVVAAQSSPPAILMLLLLILGASFGMLTSAVALWRSGAVPRAAVLMILAFLVVDFFLYEGFGIAPAWASHVFNFVGACWIASAVLAAQRAGPSDDAPKRASLIGSTRQGVGMSDTK
jgi:hypothetical protein